MQILPGTTGYVTPMSTLGYQIGLMTLADSMFCGALYTSDSEQIMRYMDEGKVTELCKLAADLSTLPSFVEHARMGVQVSPTLPSYWVLMDCGSMYRRGSILVYNTNRPIHLSY